MNLIGFVVFEGFGWIGSIFRDSFDFSKITWAKALCRSVWREIVCLFVLSLWLAQLYSLGTLERDLKLSFETLKEGSCYVTYSVKKRKNVRYLMVFI